ncbi:MAG: MerR family transcriptional regulator [Oscillospiraceae bacterium]
MYNQNRGEEMKLSIGETARLTGVSVRTLHYYDEIGLLKPVCVDGRSGYRFYDECSLERLQTILFFRELDFSLKEIGGILSDPKFQKQEALSKQKELLRLKKERLERLMDAIDATLRGEIVMSFSAFDNRTYEAQRAQYAAEAKEKWGETDAYRESAEKTAGYPDTKWAQINAGMDALIHAFADCMRAENAPASAPAQALVRRWQDFITANHYTCTDTLLAGLGAMYTGDERFRENLDKHGAGTAQFMSDAIAHFCAAAPNP